MNEQAQGNMREISISTDVLVVGGGYIGLNTAVRIAEIGYRVIVVENGPEPLEDKKAYMFVPGIDEKEVEKQDALFARVEKNDLIEVMAHTKITSVSGVPGDFHIKLSEKGDCKERKVGAVVITTDFTIESLHEAYGVILSDTVWTQTEMENILAEDQSDQDQSEKKLKGKNIIFLSGFAQEGNPIATGRVLKSVQSVVESEGVSVHVCIGNMKVAEDGLERLFKDGRDKGASFYKLIEPPRIDMEGEKPLISFFDPVLRENVELEADIIVVEESVCPERTNKDLAELFRIDPGPIGFLQKDNVHRFPVNSNREGIFVVGPARDTLNLPASWMDMGNVVLRLKNLLGNGTIVVPQETAEVDRDKCAICLTCYRCCPHGAIYWDDKAIISPVACQACGTCAAECPQEAIQVNSFKDQEIFNEVIESCSATPSGAPLIIAFCCRNSAAEAGRMAEMFNMAVPEGLQIITVPCAGKIDIEYILGSFNEGADGVLVISCHKGNCKSDTGNIYAEWRVNDVKRMLAETGIESERVRFESLASNMGFEFASIVNSMEENIKKIGTSPFKKAG